METKLFEKDRLDYQPLFGKGARAPSPKGMNEDRTRESGGNRAYENGGVMIII